MENDNIALATAAMSPIHNQPVQRMEVNDGMLGKRYNNDNNDDCPNKKTKTVTFTGPEGVTYAIPVNNKFEALKHDATTLNGPSTYAASSKKSGATNQRSAPKKTDVNTPKKARVPPVNVKLSTTITRNVITNVMKDLAIEAYSMKTTKRDEVAVYTTTTADFKKVGERLTSKEYPWYTHDLAEEKYYKVFVQGLEDSNVTELEQALSAKGFHPVEVKAVKPRNPRYEGHMNYILFFKKGTVLLEDLRKNNLIHHSAVKFDTLRGSKDKNPTQCRNCLLPGHGTRNCHLPPKCMNCASDHKTDDCPHFTEALRKHEEAGGSKDDVVPLDIKFKCSNCGGEHRGNDLNCPARKQHQSTQRFLSQRNRRQPTFTHKDEDFPREFGDVQAPVFNNMAYNRVASTPAGQQQHIHGRPSRNPFQNFPPPGTSSTLNSTPNDLFTIEELNALMSEMFARMSVCTSKAEQFQVIASLSCKYIYNDLK